MDSKALFLFIQLDPEDPPQLCAKVLQRRNIEFKVIYGYYPNAFSHIHASMFKGIIVLGGFMAAWEEDEYRWLKDVKSLMKQALNENVPILGLCLGAQLLANIVGGTNYVGKYGPEFSYFDGNWTKYADSDVLCKYIRANKLEETLYSMHMDTFSLPQSGCYCTEKEDELQVKLLASTVTPYDAIFKVGDCSYGFQAHVELRHHLQMRWIDLIKESISANGQNPNDLINEAEKRKERMERNSCLLLSRWYDLCLRHSTNLIASKI